MPGSTIATLDITIPAYQPQPGFTAVTATNGATYYFKFGGGSDGNGNFDEIIGTQVTLSVNLICDARWVIVPPVVLTDPDAPGNPQLSATVAGDGRSAAIIDKNTTADNGYYGLTIRDNDPGANGCTFYCDPGIGNRPSN